MSVITDRAQGGGSIVDGQIELLVHRRHVQQDIYVFGEPLDEMAYGKGLVVRGTHTLLFDDVTNREKNSKGGSSTLRSIVHERSRQPTISFFQMNYTSDQWIKSFHWSKVHRLTVYNSLETNEHSLSISFISWGFFLDPYPGM